MSCVALATFSLVSLIAADASANSAMGLQGLVEATFLLVGFAALLLAGILGMLSWVTVLRPPKAVSWILGRGFLGVSAVIAFAFGGVCLLIGVSSSAKGGFSGSALVFVSLLTCVFLGVEFAIAGVLYWRSNKHRPSWLAQLLSVVSFVFSALFGLCAGAVAVLGLSAALLDDKPRLDAETRRYQDGCAANRGSDCNLLGLRYRTGAVGLPRDTAKAAEAFQKGCDLETGIACRNLAAQYASGEGVPKDAERADQLTRRYEALRTKAPKGAAR